jgi:DNA primase
MSAIDEIKAKLDIVDIISAVTPLKKAGNVYKALCPFHGEKTESFVVFPHSQSWHCFGQCSEGGDLFKFVMKHQGLDFREALTLLAQKAGVTLEQFSSGEAKQRQEAQQQLYGILKETAQFYHDQLPASIAAEYLAKRGLSETTAQQFSLGYAPNEWAKLTQHLQLLGYPPEALIQANVTVRHEETGKLFDRFRDRFIIPIRDEQGRVIGFGGRALADDRLPKYINSPQSDLFDKSSIVFGYDLARRAIRESETVVVVEGYLDVIQAHQAGFRNVVGTMGTALTKQHVQLLSKHANRLVLALDTDAAGIKATLRGLDVAREELSERGGVKVLDVNGILRQSGKLKMDIRVLQLPYGKDPDDFIRKYPDQWPQQVAQAQALAHYLIELAKTNLPPNASVLERERAAREVLPLLMVEDSVINQHYLQHLSLELKLDERAMLEWVQSHLNTRSLPSGQSQGTRQQRHYEKVKNSGKPLIAPARQIEGANIEFSITQKTRAIERHCMSILLQQPYRVFDANRLLQWADGQGKVSLALPLSAEDFSQSEYQTLFEALQQATQQFEQPPLEFILERVDEALQLTVNEMVLEQLESYTRRSPLAATEVAALYREKYPPAQYDANDDFAISFVNLRLQRLEREIDTLSLYHREAQVQQDEARAQQCEHAINLITSALYQLNQTKQKIIHPNLKPPAPMTRVKDQTR